jgi:hypothetical protein
MLATVRGSMGLFSKWEGEIDLPPLSERKLRVGGNWVVQRVFNGATGKAKIYDSQFSGHDLVVTELDAPYHEFLLRKKGARRVTTPTPTLVSPDNQQGVFKTSLRHPSIFRRYYGWGVQSTHRQGSCRGFRNCGLVCDVQHTRSLFFLLDLG